jgi:hypothetical protein
VTDEEIVAMCLIIIAVLGFFSIAVLVLAL